MAAGTAASLDIREPEIVGPCVAALEVGAVDEDAAYAALAHLGTTRARTSRSWHRSIDYTAVANKWIRNISHPFLFSISNEVAGNSFVYEWPPQRSSARAQNLSRVEHVVENTCMMSRNNHVKITMEATKGRFTAVNGAGFDQWPQLQR
jgi:hypothetical protein